MARIRLKPEIVRKKYYEVKERIIGIPYTYKDDILEQKIRYDRVLNENMDYHVPIADQYHNSTIFIPFDVDFT